MNILRGKKRSAGLLRMGLRMDNFYFILVVICLCVGFTIINLATQKEHFAKGFVCSYEFFKDSNTFTSYNYEPSSYCVAFSDAFSRGLFEHAGVLE